MPRRNAIEDEFADLMGVFLRLRRDLVSFATESTDVIDGAHPNHRESAENLLHYLALRGSDLRPLQSRLASVGLSSLGRAESHVLFAVDAVLAVLHRALNLPWEPEAPRQAAVDFEEGQRLLRANTEALLGPIPPTGAWPSW